VRALGEAKGLGAGKYIHPLRVALIGRVSSPPIFDVAVGLGREATLARLDELVRRIESKNL
jgi:glutamyl-tRNA synthetase